MSVKKCYGHYGQFTILFAETFKGKINIHFLFKHIHLLHSLPFEKIVPVYFTFLHWFTMFAFCLKTFQGHFYTNRFF